MQIISDDVYLKHKENINSTITVHDMAFSVIPDLRNIVHHGFADLAVVSFTMVSIVHQILESPNFDRFLLLRRSVFAIMILYVIRTLTIIVTQIPPSDPSFCASFPNEFGALINRMFEIFTGSKKACTDMIFSGHMAFMTVSLVRWWIDTTKNRQWIKLCKRLISSIHVALSAVLFLGLRLHYTVDIVLGIIIAVFVTVGVELICWYVYISLDSNFAFQAVRYWVEASGTRKGWIHASTDVLA
ncbi:hypothetical protein ROZALSC1DRAFT_28269 [Rozella allomycis CSF55]|uniref:Sphingomyelin synthase-like domain-containing protein n=1 Tax=Rozella allomycis (strain CSF55) TaxID=988480 RepID=A0A075AUA4_ROZAC|nr:hypothetical protein O9G_002449 [Rozella allomycis CSF55]RKP20221.1 hypothetical protein ROZALSC1DRAFT_28269 [Rozella allomycis CSF55]|eukprot:EPZ33886.1 hypothetical protein O9G_002449 [Rozella allomycis CSF55]